MSNVIRVTILSDQDRTLQTEDGDGRNVVHQHQDPQPITWELDVNPKSAGFMPKGSSPPAIEWLRTTPAGTFKTPHLTQHDRTLRVDDQNDATATAGDWPYRLSAMINGLVYQTVPKSPTQPAPGATSQAQTAATIQAQPTGTLSAKTVSDPVIINR